MSSGSALSGVVESPLARTERAGTQTPVVAIAYVFAAAITAVAVTLVARAPAAGPLSETSRLVLALLSVNLVLILALAAIVGWRVARLVGARGDPGVRLHLRFVTLFAGAAVAPAVVVALFFGLLVTRGVDSWFSERVGTVVESFASVNRDLLAVERDELGAVVGDLAAGLDGAAPILVQSPLRVSGVLTVLAAQADLVAAYLIDDRGAVLARAESPGAPRYVAPPPATLAEARRSGEVIAKDFPLADLFRAVYRLEGFEGVHLYVVKAEEQGLLERANAAYESVRSYREAQDNRARIQTAFALSYVETALLVLVGAVWLGMSAANRIAAPVGRLVRAADRVAGGDLTARVRTEGDPQEIAVLSHAFNRMTHDLSVQQEALRAAGEEAETRRRFIETVLSRVSAGVIGLDGNGRISAANRQALALLDVDDGEARGRALAEVAPELAEVAARASMAGVDAEAEIDVVRTGETRRLRARASPADDAGLVLTFDDITRLVAAQRNAAWRDVARRIAHEIKNPLTPIQLSAERLRRKFRGEITGDLETFDRCTDTIVRQVGDIGRMVDEFSSFARMPAPRFARENAAELLRQAVFAQRVASPDTSVEMQEPAPQAALMCDGRLIAQALANVLKNAAESVEARRTAAPELPGRILARLRIDAGDVVFEIEDNGVGLPTRDRDRLTEPYVTTREKGTGLGLAIVRRVVEDHGGALVLADAETLSGAKVMIRLPGEHAAPAAEPALAGAA